MFFLGCGKKPNDKSIETTEKELKNIEDSKKIDLKRKKKNIAQKTETSELSELKENNVNKNVNDNIIALHDVKKGETLAKIAMRYYGREHTRKGIKAIIEANKSYFSQISPTRNAGKKLIIPKLNKNINEKP